FWNLRQMGSNAIDKLKGLTHDKRYHANVEWLGTMWSHAVVTSTPVPDIRLHMMAWRHHYAAVFGTEALNRVRGFSPPEMHLPIHPDVCFEYVKALKACGYRWVMLQEHTIENPDGSGIRRPHMPHRLVARNSAGETVEIAALVKTQGSDTKLVAQMQPYYEAKGLDRQELAGKSIPPFVCQIGDGENGGVMMNEFPPMYNQAYNEIGWEGAVAMNGTEYLEFLDTLGVKEKDYLPVQPITQKRLWDKIGKRLEPGAADKAIDEIRKEDSNYNLDRASWTSDRNWVAGYESVLDPMHKLSARFHEKFDKAGVDRKGFGYRNALLLLLLSQTSCFRYWGEGIWTEYAREICRRGLEAVESFK
ncbi:MAG: glycosyl hydrolase family 57, partial [Candidatus Omnitrophica bacterium]|nr:glycosyl hydrolase family 57 [Candidatus Omnitrophota bacterium]